MLFKKMQMVNFKVLKFITLPDDCKDLFDGWTIKMKIGLPPEPKEKDNAFVFINFNATFENRKMSIETVTTFNIFPVSNNVHPKTKEDYLEYARPIKMALEKINKEWFCQDSMLAKFQIRDFTIEEIVSKYLLISNFSKN